MDNFGPAEILEQIRIRNNLSKTEMAQRLGILKSNYSMIIHGYQSVSKKIACKAQAEFGILMEELICKKN